MGHVLLVVDDAAPRNLSNQTAHHPSPVGIARGDDLLNPRMIDLDLGEIVGV